jgi:hypothetical protein
LFDAEVSMNVRFVYEQQLWAAGARLYSGETRARCKASAIMTIELTKRLDFKEESKIPDLMFRARVTEAKVDYKDLVVEHTLGMGGDAAKLLGKAMHEVVKVVKPDIEKDLKEKANKAIIKAADTKEIRIELEKLLSKDTKPTEAKK